MFVLNGYLKKLKAIYVAPDFLVCLSFDIFHYLQISTGQAPKPPFFQMTPQVQLLFAILKKLFLKTHTSLYCGVTKRFKNMIC